MIRPRLLRAQWGPPMMTGLLLTVVSALSALPDAALATEYYVAPAADFRSNQPGDFVPGADIFDWDLGYEMVHECAHAPVVLPQGATVTSMTAYLYDNDNTANIYVNLRRRASTGGGPAENMAAVTSSLDSTSVVPYPDFTIDYAGVDNDAYTYFLVFCSYSTLDIHLALHRLYAVRVGYTP